MSFSEDQFVSKLNSLEDSQESIASASKWLLSQYREAPQVAECWKNYMLKQSVNTRRKLLAIYLTNHVVQQAKGKKIGQFQIAFGNVAAQVLQAVYPDLPRDLKKKVKRVCNIWRDRGIFSKDVLDRIQTCLNAESLALEPVALPAKLKVFADSYGQMSKIEPNARAMKTRFDKAVESLDPSSVVYEENLKTVTKIGQVAKGTMSQSINLRESCVEMLQELLNEEKRILDEERNTLGEIEMILLSKDPSNINQATSDDNILPSYEAGNDDDDDDEDDDSSSSHSDSDQAGGESGAVVKGLKRPSDRTANEELQNKKSKASSEEINQDILEEAYEPETLVTNQDEENLEGATTVTSSIQDLLSKLAN